MAMRHGQEPLWMSFKKLRATPEDILLHFGIVTPPIDVEQLARDLDCDVTYLRSPGWAGALTVVGTRATIWVKNEDDSERKRFTIAHEIGHLLLHDTTTAFRDSSYSGTPLESEANRFAADLLMPMWMIGPLALEPKTLGQLYALAKRFEVSPTAMRRRVDEALGLPVPF